MNSKENIINRMYKHAMGYLGIKKIENLDPLIKLLLEGLASELFSIAQEMENSNHRMLDKIARLLIPDLSISHMPAHGIAHIRSQRPQYVISTKNGMFCEPTHKRNSSATTFYPVKDTPVYAGDVRRIIHMGEIYDISDAMTKNHIAHTYLPEMEPMKRTLWIGLELALNLKKTGSLTLFFNLPVRKDRQKLYSLLSYAKWSINGIPLICKPDILKNSETHDIFEIYDTETTIRKDILACYANQFYSIEWNLSAGDMERRYLPAEVEEYYPQELCREQKEKLYWFKMELPLQFDMDAIEELEIFINAVIVENKYLNTLTTDAINPTTIVPLQMKAGHYFLSVSDVTDALDRSYHSIPRITGENRKEGVYSIRHGGCERLNASELKDSLYRQMDLIYDHSALIPTADKNMFFTQVSRIHELFEAINKNFSKIDTAAIAPHSYLIVDTLKNGEIIYVSYWSTLCEAANNILSGTSLTPLADSALIDKNVMLLTTTRGGKDLQKNNGNLTAYRYLLTTRDRIFTEYDIIDYCRKELDGILTSVEVKKGFIKSEFPQEGLVRSLDIYLQTRENIDLSVLEDLKNKLTARSPSSFHYRIFLSNKQKM
nr:type VI secretion system baseplate subunit TssF [Bacteroides acidifaciens]